MKPRLFISEGEWVCVDHICTYPKSGIRIFVPLGSGKSPKEAYRNAFPLGFFEKIIEFYITISNKVR